MKLASQIQGEGPPLIVAHGLFGSARNWGVIAKRLADLRRVIAVDLRNHGESPWSEDHSYRALASDLAELAEETGPADVLGHSMGGKAAMVLALTRPELMRQLIVADIAPVRYGHTQADLIAALRSIDLGTVTRRSDADVQLAKQIPEAGVRAFLLQSLDVAAKRWRLNLDALDAQMDRIIGWPDIDGRYDGPTLFISGEKSDYVGPAERKAAARLFPSATFRQIDGAGHWLHAEQPRAFEAALRETLA